MIELKLFQIICKIFFNDNKKVIMNNLNYYFLFNLVKNIPFKNNYKKKTKKNTLY